MTDNFIVLRIQHLVLIAINDLNLTDIYIRLMPPRFKVLMAAVKPELAGGAPCVMRGVVVVFGFVWAFF
jgi:hypothetical protein